MARKYGELSARGRVPDARGLVVRGSDDAPPVGRERGAAHVSALVVCGRPSPWPERTASCAPLAASQMRAVRSLEAVTMRRPSGENATLRTTIVMAGESGDLA